MPILRCFWHAGHSLCYGSWIKERLALEAGLAVSRCRGRLDAVGAAGNLLRFGHVPLGFKTKSALAACQRSKWPERWHLSSARDLAAVEAG